MRRKIMLLVVVAMAISAIYIFGDQVRPDLSRFWEGGSDYIKDGGGGYLAATERYATSEIQDDVIQANDAFVKLGKDIFEVAASVVSDIDARIRETLNRSVLPPLPKMNLSRVSISARDALSSRI